jgi:thiamine biosynthesis lipoprotein
MTSQSTSRVISSGSKDKPSLAIALAAVVVVFLAYSSPLSAEWFGDSQAHMGTEVSVYLWHDDAEKGQKAVEAVFAEVARLDQLMSTYKEDSEISAINRNAAKQPVVTGDELFALIRRSLDISVLTLGAFDITYDSVGQHYDFREGRRPSEETIASELGHINYRYVETDRGRKTIFFAQQGVRGRRRRRDLRLHG